MHLNNSGYLFSPSVDAENLHECGNSHIKKQKGDERRGEERGGGEVWEGAEGISFCKECVSSSGRANASPTQHPGNYLRIVPFFLRHD